MKKNWTHFFCKREVLDKKIVANFFQFLQYKSLKQLSHIYVWVSVYADISARVTCLNFVWVNG